MITLLNVHRRLLRRLDGVSPALSLLLCRLAVATVFWRSGRTKVHGLFTLNDTTIDLFREEYRVPVLPPEVAAVLATVLEHGCPILLVLGLAGRPAAAALLGMTAVIEIFVYPESWPDHLLWTAALLPIILRGPGAWSLDRLIAGAVARRVVPAWK